MHGLLYDKHVLLRVSYDIYTHHYIETNCPASLSHEIVRVTAIWLVANEVHVHHVTRIARIYMTLTFHVIYAHPAHGLSP
jgi:hypothetical protein